MFYYTVSAFTLEPVAAFQYLSDAELYAETASKTEGATKHGVEYTVTQVTFDNDETPLQAQGIVTVFLKGEKIFASYRYNEPDDANQNYATRYQYKA